MTGEDCLRMLGAACGDNRQCLELLTTHSRAVADLCLEIIDRRGLGLDREFVETAALLHDIGVVKCDAPSIHCHGSEPYIRHGVEGRAMLEAAGLLRHALVCERHTGSGITAAEIVAQRLPLPLRDMVPQSEEEELVCYADKFFSKSRTPERQKSASEAYRSVSKFGEASAARFRDMHSKFGLEELGPLK